MPTRA